MSLFRSVILLVMVVFNLPAFAANGDRSSDLYLSHGNRGLKGEVQWGVLGMRLDFAFPTAHGHLSKVSLVITGETGDAYLLLHDSRQVIEGTWPVSVTPSPMDLVMPGLAETPTTSVGVVNLGGLRCDVREGDMIPGLRVWYPQSMPQTPRLVRYEEGGTAFELGLADIRPTNLVSDELAVPEGYRLLPVSLDGVLMRGDRLEAGAEALLWMSSVNLYREVKTMQFDVVVEAP